MFATSFRSLHQGLGLGRALHGVGVEANPIPVKWAMARMGLCGGTLRLPMTPLEASNEALVEGALRACNLI